MSNVNLSASATAGATVKDEVGLTIRRGATGRTVSALTQEEKEQERLVLDWLQGSTERLDHRGRAIVLEALRSTDVAAVGTAFRYRRYGLSEAPSTPSDIGPNPHSPANRYNLPGQLTLYLSSSIEGLAAESKVYLSNDERAFYARFLLDAGALRVADLGPMQKANVLHQAFDAAEAKSSDYREGQRLANAVREIGFDGMLIPGVRGSPANRYSNIVVFNCKNWRDWLDLNFPPALLT